MCIGSKIRSTIPSGNGSTYLATGLHPGIESIRTAVRKVSKFVLQSPTQIIDEARSDSASPRAWILPYQQPPISIDTHIVVNAPHPATTLQHLNQSRDTFPSQMQRGVIKFTLIPVSPSTEDDVFDNTSHRNLWVVSRNDRRVNGRAHQVCLYVQIFPLLETRDDPGPSSKSTRLTW